MERKYKVRFFQNSTYEVIEIVTTYGERTSAYDSEPNTVQENKVYQGGVVILFVETATFKNKS